MHICKMSKDVEEGNHNKFSTPKILDAHSYKLALLEKFRSVTKEPQEGGSPKNQLEFLDEVRGLLVIEQEI